jgi:hypothetical protein
MPVLFASALFLNALLIFWVQPLFAKMVLPLLGGSPSVWTTCMLFFQAALLAGYAYGHIGIRTLGIRRHALLHCVLVWLPLLVLPIVVDTQTAKATDQPIVWLLQTMGTTVGLPFVVLASTAPLLQRWYSSLPNRSAADPYWLYSASNVGSFAALIAFPILLEPMIPLGHQTTVWRVVYAIVAGLLTACAISVLRREPSSLEVPGRGTDDSLPGITTGMRLRWLALSFAPSTLMLGVTTYLSTDVAPVPLLWVLPLGCYLLTFIVAFGWYSDRMHTNIRRLLPSVVLPLVLLIVSGAAALAPLWIAVPIHLLAFTVLAMLCHGELARDRPGVQHLTEFYLWLAAGGVLGGVFNTLVAPRVFTSVAEYPLAIAFACLVCVPKEQFWDALATPRSMLKPALAAGLATVLLVAARLGGVARLPTLAFVGAPALIFMNGAKSNTARFSVGVVGLLAALAIGNAVAPVGGLRTLYADRTFFGVYRVRSDPARNFVSLVHGTTTHGRQVVGDPNPEPLTYFHRQSPIGQLFKHFGADARSVGVIGLGTGTLGAYAQPGSQWTFYEIDAAVERIARDARFFHYLERCAADCSVVLGDARLTLSRSSVAHDILVLDAFSSDAIPIHLLTMEALRTYEARLSENGVLALHISNRHINLAPVVARLARDRGLTALLRRDMFSDAKNGFESSEWVVMARRPDRLKPLARDTTRWRPLVADARPAWTDDFSNIWTELR